MKESFDPQDPKYKTLADLPKSEQADFKESALDNSGAKGFVRKKFLDNKDLAFEMADAHEQAYEKSKFHYEMKGNSMPESLIHVLAHADALSAERKEEIKYFVREEAKDLDDLDLELLVFNAEIDMQKVYDEVNEELKKEGVHIKQEDSDWGAAFYDFLDDHPNFRVSSEEFEKMYIRLEELGRLLELRKTLRE